MSFFARLNDEIEKWHNEKAYRPLTVISSAQSSRVSIGGREVVQLSSNNYLGLTSHPRLKKAAAVATAKWGVGTGSVRTIAGNLALHKAYEQRLAAFKETEAALTFQSGFTANLAVLTSLLTKDDAVFSDELNHASIIDGIRLTKAKRYIYKHSDMKALEEALADSTESDGRLIVTDGVFSMDGDIALLPEIVKLAKKYKATVMVDDAHASGVLGRNGRGSVDYFSLHGQVPIQVGTLSKAIGVVGGYVAGPKVLIDYLSQRARPFLFSTSQPPGVIAACDAALDVLLQEPQLIDQLWKNTNFFKSGLKNLGFNIGPGQTPITPIMLEEDSLAMQFSDLLLGAGVYAQGIYFPTVPKGRARIRTIVTALHSKEDLAFCLHVFERTGQALGII
ncbi:MAG: 8-amino-7-oxononanoate synthase 1 [Bacillota bacterium]